MYQRFLSGLFLGTAAAIDLKCRKVYLQLAAGYFLLTAAGHIFHREQGIVFFLTGLLPGLFCLTVSWISREGLGYGDSLMILIMRVVPGVFENRDSGISRVLLCRAALHFPPFIRESEQQTQLPFLPFLFLADMIWEILSCLGG